MIQPGAVDSVIGAAPPPAAPPSVSATSLDIVADPVNPGPGQLTTLTITASGNHGADKYGIKDVNVSLKVDKSPGNEAKVSPDSATTDASGTAIAKFTPSRTKGLNSLTVAAGTLTTQYNIDTLVGSSGAQVRGRHSGSLDPSPAAVPAFNPLLIFAIAGVALVLGFAVPYRRKLGGMTRSLGGILPRRKVKGASYGAGAAAKAEGYGPSSRKKSRARP